jgi:carbonic anhydrase
VGSSAILRNNLHFPLHAFGFHYLLVSMDGKYNAFEMDIVHDKSSTLLSVLGALDTMVYSYSAKNISFVRVGRGLHKLGVYSHGRYEGN